MIRFDAAACGNLAQASQREWIETNGLGGFASSTITGLNTRRYHGLLMASLHPPVDRFLLLSKLEETLVIDGQRHELGVNYYPGAVYPRGFELLREFRADPFPTFVYSVNGYELRKQILMVHGENTTIVEYELTGGMGECELEVRPLIAFRDFHSLTHANPFLDGRIDERAGMIALHPYQGCPALYLGHDADAVDASGNWYFRFQYEVERERGLDFEEDLFNPLVMRFRLGKSRKTATVIASSEQRQASAAPALREAEARRRREVAGDGDDFTRAIRMAADQFIVKRADSCSVIAGYPWFSDWGRDTMISLPGLALATGRFAEAKAMLREFARHVSEGMLPNRFPDHGEAPEYNTVDATLWFFEAARAYVAATGDSAFFHDDLEAVFRDIIAWHERGTRYGIRVDSDGLLRCGEAGVQLTWMDAKVGDWVVTPRYGKPVEIQALWYNALKVMEQFTGNRAYAERAERVAASFNREFWNDAARCLYDVVDGDVRDGSIRPNQVFAASLHYSMLSPERAAAVLDTVRRELLTPYGLRTLSPYDPRYRGIYCCGVAERDGAYHQGTVWPWLIGPYVEAWRKVYGSDPDVLGDLKEYLLTTGVGQIAEIFDGDTPHLARGCFAQAWSVAELLRVTATTALLQPLEAAAISA